jgi:hypothetical protein
MKSSCFILIFSIISASTFGLALAKNYRSNQCCGGDRIVWYILYDRIILDFA